MSRPENAIIKFASDTTVVGLVHNGDKSVNKFESSEILTTWCCVNNLSLNTSKPKEPIMAFRRNRAEPAPLHINRETISTV